MLRVYMTRGDVDRNWTILDEKKAARLAAFSLSSMSG
jgi:hypothetical protein